MDLDGSVEGLEDVLEAQRGWLSQWERPFSVEAEELIPAGDARRRAHPLARDGRGSGVELEAEGAHVWEIREGEAVRWDVYRDRDRALADAGAARPEAGDE